MSEFFRLGERGPFFWTRQLGEQMRAELEMLLHSSRAGATVVISLDGVQAFDSSFANEFFGRTLLRLPVEYQGRCLVVESLDSDVLYDLEETLKSLGLIMAMRKEGQLELIGKVHPADRVTFSTVVDSGGSVAASEVKERLGINLTTVNERLTKLTERGVLRRESAVSPTGRVEFRYWPPE